MKLKLKILFLLTFGILLLQTNMSAQEKGKDGLVKFEADWKSLDTRKNPEWFADAKLGIFIHWGVYSVPSYTKKGGYAEWYYRGYTNKQSAVWKFHKSVYGENFKYEDFAPLFKAELFNPDEWADLFVKSGAKYIVLTSKHHDGYCLWPNEQRPNWNSMVNGPKRDLVGDLTKSVRSAGLKMGLYYSLAEWNNPIYTWDHPKPDNNVDKYVNDHMIPQFKDLVTRYKPSLLFVDGEWSHGSKTWRSEEIVSWLYNQPDLQNDLVVNDRWGGDTRFKHGGYFATEYTEGMKDTESPWEECRGLGASFGYNRNESLNEYIKPKELIQMFVKLVSNGGNLLLNIGPAADGTIPVIMQERLMQLGSWLKTNGEAVYSTRKFKFTEEGENIRFTKSKDGKYVYALSLKWPGGVLNLKRVKPVPGSQIYLLGIPAPLQWRYDEREGLLVTIPDSLRDKFNDAESYAYTLKIEGAPSNIAEHPLFSIEGKEPVKKEIFVNSIKVNLFSSIEGAEIYYTTDGSEPTFASAKYTAPVELKKSSVIKAFAYKPGMIRSLSDKAEFVKTDLLKPTVVKNCEQGLDYSYYEQRFYELPDFAKLTPTAAGKTDKPDISLRKKDDFFAFRFNGYIEVPESGVYSFYLSSDDGSRLYIGDTLVVDNDGLHGADNEVRGQIALAKGMHPIKIDYFEGEWDQSLKVCIKGPGLPKQEIPAKMYFRNK